MILNQRRVVGMVKLVMFCYITRQFWIEFQASGNMGCLLIQYLNQINRAHGFFGHVGRANIENFWRVNNRDHLKNKRAILKNNKKFDFYSLSGSYNKKYLNKIISYIEEQVRHGIIQIGYHSVIAELFAQKNKVAIIPLAAGRGLPSKKAMINVMLEIEQDEVKSTEPITPEPQNILLINKPIIPTEFFDIQNETSHTRIKTEGIEVITIVGKRLDVELDEAHINAVNEITSKEKVILNIIGPITDRQYKRLLHINKINQVNYTNRLSEILKESDIFLNPHRSGGGYAAALAAALGVPVLTTDFGDAKNFTPKKYRFKNTDQLKEFIINNDMRSLKTANCCLVRDYVLKKSDTIANVTAKICDLLESN